MKLRLFLVWAALTGANILCQTIVYRPWTTVSNESWNQAVALAFAWFMLHERYED